jgi:hypothetical protein
MSADLSRSGSKLAPSQAPFECEILNLSFWAKATKPKNEWVSTASSVGEAASFPPQFLRLAPSIFLDAKLDRFNDLTVKRSIASTAGGRCR